MSTTEIRQPISFESIPLQTLTGPSILPNDTEDVQPDINTAQIESSDSTVDPVPEEAVSEHAELPPTRSNSVLEKWQLGLNATQVLTGVLAFSGFLAMIKFTIIDHYINKDSLKLSQWTAWMTFRDECRALLGETRDIGPDCQDVLYQPLSKPPVPMAESPSHDGQNLTLAVRTALEARNMQNISASLRVLGLSDVQLTLFSGIFTLSLVLGLWYVATCRSSSPRKNRRTEFCGTWVADNVARLSPDQSIGYATAQDTVSWLGIVRRRVSMKRETPTEKQHDEFLTSSTFKERPASSIDFESLEAPFQSHLLEDREAAGQDEDGAEQESAWLPTANNPQDEEKHSPSAYEYLYTLELILDKLDALGYKNFAFDHVNEHTKLDQYLTVSEDMDFPCSYSSWSPSASWVKNLSTHCSIFPHQFMEVLRTTTSNLSWLIKIPDMNPKAATVCLTGIGPEDTYGMWRYWDSERSTKQRNCSRDGNCLYVTSIGEHHARFIFHDMTPENYNFILSCLKIDGRENTLGPSWPTRFWPNLLRWKMELYSGIMEQIFFAAEEGSLYTYALPCTQRDGGLIFEGSWVKHSLKDIGIGRLIRRSEEHRFEQGAARNEPRDYLTPAEFQRNHWLQCCMFEGCNQSFKTSQEMSAHMTIPHYTNHHRSPSNRTVPLSARPFGEPRSSSEAYHDFRSKESQIARCTVCGRLCTNRLFDFTSGTAKLRKPMCTACLQESEEVNEHDTDESTNVNAPLLDMDGRYSSTTDVSVSELPDCEDSDNSLLESAQRSASSYTCLDCNEKFEELPCTHSMDHTARGLPLRPEIFTHSDADLDKLQEVAKRRVLRRVMQKGRSMRWPP